MTRHRLDTFSALAGAACLALAAAVVFRAGPLGLSELRLAGPLVVLALGISLLASGGRVARAEHVERAQDTDGTEAGPAGQGGRSERDGG